MALELEHLRNQGIHLYGSEELHRYETRLTRFFAREYRALSQNPRSLDAYGISADQGPILSEAGALMAEHYDQPFRFFRAFLDDRYLAYSMAYFGDSPEEIARSTLTLEEAQHNKFRLICERAKIAGNERILNIGCGFGSLEAYLLEQFPKLEIVSVTASKTQADYIREKQATKGHPFHSAKLTLLERDINLLSAAALGGENFDLVISIAVFEQVWNLEAAFRLMADLLRPGGSCFLHLIVSTSPFPQYFDSRSTPVGKYFPGGRVWPHDELSRGRQGLALEESWYLNGMNYYRTLGEWHKRFSANIQALYSGGMSLPQIRHWNHYFSICKVVLFSPANGSFFGNGHYRYRKGGPASANES